MPAKVDKMDGHGWVKNESWDYQELLEERCCNLLVRNVPTDY